MYYHQFFLCDVFGHVAALGPLWAPYSFQEANYLPTRFFYYAGGADGGFDGEVRPQMAMELSGEARVLHL